LFGIAPLAVRAVVHRSVEAQVTRKHVDIGSLQTDFAIRDSFLAASDPGRGKELPNLLGRFQQWFFLADQRVLPIE
jgi:hypothetical protein